MNKFFEPSQGSSLLTNQTARLWPLAVFTFTLAFYVYTLQPSLSWGDGIRVQREAISGESFLLAELTSVEFAPDPFPFAKVGVAAWDHPLYIMLAHTLVWALPKIESLWLVNLISAIFGSATIAVVFELCWLHTGSRILALYSALALAVSHTFWWHSVTPEVYTLFVFLLLLSLYLLDGYERTKRRWVLLGSAFMLGLATSDHLLAFLALPALTFYYLLSRHHQQPKPLSLGALALPTLAFLSGFSPYLIQFARLLRTFPINQIMGPVIGATFLRGLLETTPALLGKSLVTYLALLTLQFSPLGLILGAYGLWAAASSRDPFRKKTMAFFVVYTVFGVIYRVADQFAFFLTSYVFWAVAMAIGAAQLVSFLPHDKRRFLTAMMTMVVLGTPIFYNALPGLARKAGITDASLRIPQIGEGVRDGLAYFINPNKRSDFSAYLFGQETLESLAPEAVVVAMWYPDAEEYYVLRYFTASEGLRPDVTILGWQTLDPFTFDPQLVWQEIDRYFSHRPVYLASLSEQFYAASELMKKYCVVPENNLYRLYPRGSMEAEIDRKPCLDTSSNLSTDLAPKFQVENFQGKTSLEVATQLGYQATVELVQKHGVTR